MSIAVYDFRLGCKTYDLSPAEITKRLHQLGKKFVFQQEIGEENSYLHWQGRVSLWKKTTVKKATDYFRELFPGDGDYRFKPLSENCLLSGNVFNYVMKLASRVDGPWSDRDVPAYVPRQYAKTPYPWQQAILDSSQVFDTRHINVLVDGPGNLGKSTLVGIARFRHGWMTLNCLDDGKRLMETACDKLIASQNRTPHFMIDIPRAIDNRGKAGVFAAIEMLKSGVAEDSRNSYKEWAFDSPTIWVFTNNDVPLKYFSDDRWIFWEIKDDQLIKLKM